MHRAASALSFIALAAVALAGCERPPIDCSPFMYDESRRTCVCPTGTVELDDGSCMLPDGGVIFPPGVDAGPRTDAGTDAAPDPIDGSADACELRTYYRDADGDGAGDPTTPMQACSMPDGFVENDDDCDDSCMTCRPGGTEVCDDNDNDCDGSTDEDVLSLYFRDADGDSFGNPTMPMQACSIPDGFVENDDDCDDSCMTCRPGGTEVCDLDMRDENCMGGGNEGCACADGMTRACPGGSDIGECVAGTQTCAGGAWGACVGAVGPTGETCNAADDDCNMIPDDGAAVASCGSASRTSRVGCSAGVCFVSECVTGWRDCDVTFANGCEAQLGTATHCTACGDVCGWDCEATGCNDAIALSTGLNFTCALRESGNVVCWGGNNYGQLGTGTTTASLTPATVASITDATAITAGDSHACALRRDGNVRCWGRNNYGQLGDGSTTSSSTPVAVASLSGVVAISAGSNFTCAVRASGTVHCWGDNVSGQLGGGMAGTRSLTPVLAPLSGGAIATAVTAGAFHTCALLSDRTVRCWGEGTSGQLGQGRFESSTTAVSVASLDSVTSIEAGDEHTCAVRSDGTARCWGGNAGGGLGDGSTRARATAVTVAGLAGAVAIAAGVFHTCAVLSTGGVSCWGYNTHGQLGDGSTTTRTTPVATVDVNAVSDIDARNHSCALTREGAIRCWGNNTSGQLGDRTLVSSSLAVAAGPP